MKRFIEEAPERLKMDNPSNILHKVQYPFTPKTLYFAYFILSGVSLCLSDVDYCTDWEEMVQPPRTIYSKAGN